MSRIDLITDESRILVVSVVVMISKKKDIEKRCNGLDRLDKCNR